MRFASTAAAATALGAGLANASPVIRQATGMSACANITQAYAQVPKNETSSAYVRGQLAYDCLMSMPFDSVLGSAYVLETTKYLQFQSTIPNLKNPPQSYLSPAVDLLGGMSQIYQKANSSQYQSQYELDTEMTNLLASANDGHLSAGFCSQSIFIFSYGSDFSIYSLSSDGVELPSLYLATDILAERNSNGTANVSDIVQINGQNATQYLEKSGLLTSNQDPDAQYNNGLGVITFANGRWPGSSSLSLTFANGSTTSYPLVAKYTGSHFNYTSGQSLYADWCLPINTTSTSSSNATSTTTTLPTSTAGLRGYPTPHIRDPYNKILGYYINETGYNDTAVLQVPDFETVDTGIPDAEQATFAYVASKFVNDSLAEGKTKMVIDISGNPGGNIDSGFDLFKLFFPDMAAYSATRMRDHDAERLMLKIYASFDPVADRYWTSGNPFYYGAAVTPDQESDFATWEQLYGPDNINGANLTSLFANNNFTAISTTEAPIRGYGGVPTNVTGSPFPAENIIIVSDGRCASTCTTFVNLMTVFGGVRTVAVGGRPINAPMQAIGGVRGAQSMQWTNLYENVEETFERAYNSSKTNNPILTQEEFELADATFPIALSSFPLQITAASCNLNLRNSYNPDHDTAPLQFAYQPANCKIFNTLENLYYPSTVWISAANAMWGNGTCVSGSVTNGTITYE